MKPATAKIKQAYKLMYAERIRLYISLCITLISGFLTYVYVTSAGIIAADFTWAWRGAQFLIANTDPYAAIKPEGAYPFNDYLYYPLPALLLAIPLTWMPGPFAAAVFMGCSSGLLSWGVTKKGMHRLIIFASPSYLYALVTVQWSPLITAAALLPSLAFVLPAKPNLGLAVLIAYPDRKRLIWASIPIILSLAIMPTWPIAMLRQVGTHINYTPVLTWYGPLLLGALLAWRTSSARLLFAMALMPQRLLYDQLPLWLVPETWRQAMFITIMAWIGSIIALVLGMGTLILPFIYLPTLGCIIYQHYITKSQG